MKNRPKEEKENWKAAPSRVREENYEREGKNIRIRRKTGTEEGSKDQPSFWNHDSPEKGENDDSQLTAVVGKTREEGLIGEFHPDHYLSQVLGERIG